jgi:predicted GTPase
MTKTELGIANSVIQEGRALVVVANKADVLEAEGVSPSK